MTEPVLWPVEPHTAAKHEILKGYLEAWMPIITSARAGRHKRVYYFDGFAGPGEYKDGEPGSPQVALQAALNHSQQFKIPVHMTFIDIDPGLVKHLEGVLNRYRPKVETSNNVSLHRRVINGDCREELPKTSWRERSRNCRRACSSSTSSATPWFPCNCWDGSFATAGARSSR